MTAVEEAAAAWHAAGACVLPAASDGTKMPAVAWKQYQTERPDADQLTEWLRGGRADGIGLLTGSSSGGLEMLELEGRAADLLEPFIGALAREDQSIIPLLLTYMERTPSGGFHFIYRVDGDVAGNQKLARRPKEPTPDSPSRFEVLIETRGEGGWTVLAPSAGRTHPSGEPWQMLGASRPGVVATLTEEQHETVLEVARSFDQMPPPEPVEHRPAMASADPGGELAPGQDFEQRADWMTDLLGPLGWTVWKRQGDKLVITRPGKRFGASATINYDGNDNLYVFTSSTDFPEFSSWTKFGAYAFLHHGGDYAAAARELRARGYGGHSEPVRILRLVHGGAGHEDGGGPASATARAPDDQIQIKTTLTDDGNAILLASRIRGTLLFCPERKQWMAWDGARWSFESGPHRAIQAMREMVRAIVPTDTAEAKHKIKSLGWKGIENAVKLTAADPDLHVSIQDLDADAWALNTPDGVVNLRTSEVTPPTPEALHTRITGCGVALDVVPERFLAFLGEIFGRAEEPEKMIEFIQRLAGWSTVGETGHQILPFLHGAGANGKSVVLEIFQQVLGSYSGTAPSDLLLATGKEDLAAQAELSGRRFVVCSEVPPTAKFHEERAKKLTGGDRVSARFLYSNFFEYTPTHHLWMAGNHQPQVPGGGSSFWRRMRLIPFNFIVPEERRVTDLARRLVEEEGPAILGWMVQGARKQSDELKLAEPSEVMAATSTYAEEEDALGRFVEDECTVGGDARANRELMVSVWERYTRWCDRNGIRPLTQTMFGRELKGRFGVGDAKSSGHRLYTRIALKTPQAQIEDDRPEQQHLS